MHAPNGTNNPARLNSPECEPAKWMKITLAASMVYENYTLKHKKRIIQSQNDWKTAQF